MHWRLPPREKFLVFFLVLLTLALQTVGAGTRGLFFCICTGTLVAPMDSCHDSAVAANPTPADCANSGLDIARAEHPPCPADDEGHCEDHLSLDHKPLLPAASGKVSPPSRDAFFVYGPFWESLPFLLSILKSARPARVQERLPLLRDPVQIATAVSVARIRVLRI